MAAVVVEIVVVVVEIVVCIPPVIASAGTTAGGSTSSIVGVFVKMLARRSANVIPAGRFSSSSAIGMSEGFPEVSMMFVLDIVINLLYVIIKMVKCLKINK